MRVRHVSLLGLLLGLSIAASAAPQGGRRPPARGASPAAFTFDPSADRLPPGFVGHDPARYYTLLNPRFTEKGEFESTQAFTERLRRALPDAAVPLTLPPEASALAYDADAGRMVVRLNRRYVFERRFVASRRIPMITPLGVRFTATEIEYLDTAADLNFERAYGLPEAAFLSVPMAPEEARRLKPLLRVLIVGHFDRETPQNAIIRETRTQTATLSDPNPYKIVYRGVALRVGEVWLYRADTGEILAKNSTAWREPVRRQGVAYGPVRARGEAPACGPDLRLDRAREALELRRPVREAIADTEALIAAEPDVAAAHLLRALLLEEEKRYDDAAAAAGRAATLAPDCVDAFVAVARVALKRKDCLTAQRAVGRARELDRHARGLRAVAMEAEYFCQSQAAQPVGPEPAPATSGPGGSAGGAAIDEALVRARDFVATNRDREALDELARVLQVRPDSAEAHALRGRVYERRGEYQKAVEAFTAAAFWNPRLIGAHIAIGRIHALNKNCAEARAAVAKALAIDPNSSEALALGRYADTKCP